MSIRWDKGGEASVAALSGDAITVRSTIPSPPGSRLKGTLDTVSFTMKVHTSRKQADGAFVIEGRLIDATREARARLTPKAETP